MLERLRNDMKEAMKAGEKEKLTTIRMLMAALKNQQIEQMEELTEEDTIAILQRELKRRLESAEQYRQGKREDLAESEEREAEIIRVYLPSPLTPEEVETAVREAVDRLGATSKKEMGRVMKEVMSAHRGRVDGKAVQAVVGKLLS